MKQKKLLLLSFLLSIFLMPAMAQTTVNGLVVVVRYNDYEINATNAQIEAMLNQESGFNLWGNTTSVKEYFKVQSNNQINLHSTVVDVKLSQNSSYYHGKNLGYDGPQYLVSDVIAAVKAKYPSGFTGLSLHPTENRLRHFSIISQSSPSEGAGVAFGLHQTQTIKNNGVDMNISNVALISYTQTNVYDVNVICHEYGHSVFSWTDFYRTAFSNLGDYCLMASAGTSKAPMPINPALRLQRGWISNVVEVSGTTTATYTVTSNSYSQIHKYTNPNNSKEYLLINALQHGGYYQSPLDNGKVMDQGLAIWYVDEDCGFDVAGVDNQYYIRLLQADNLDEMHDELLNNSDVRGDLNDLYDNVSNSFPNGHPARWKDGGEFGISISNISAPGATMTFTVNARPNTVIAASDGNGTISPKGTLSVPGGQSRSFSFTPNPGYEIDVIKVDGSPVTTANPYVMSSISGTKNIHVSFKRKFSVDSLPSPWLSQDIGWTGGGFASHASGKFTLETFSNYIDGYSDDFRFLYQPLNGNGTIVAKVSQKNRVSWNGKVGLMIRETLQDNSTMSMIAKVPHSGIRISQRTTTGAYLVNDPHQLGAEYKYELFDWLKLVRDGNNIISYCSKDGVNWVFLAQQSISMNTQVYVGMCITGSYGVAAGKAIFENVSVTNVASNGCVFNTPKITGTVIGSTGSWNNSGNTRDKAFDGNVFTYFDGNQDVVWTGLSLSQATQITGIKYFPRLDFANRMIGGKFQGSNTADFSSGVVDLATISTEPTYDWNCITVTNTSSFQYIRYICPTDGYGNVGEIEFYGTQGNISPTVSITTPANNAGFTAPAAISIAANASDADGTITKVELFIDNNTNPTGIDIEAPYTFLWSSVAAGTYNITVKATDNNGAVTTSAPVTVIVTNPATQTPYGGTAWAIPGTIEAENYDLGGQGVAFNDVTTANEGGAYRTDAVDIESFTGGYNVGYIATDEWLEYTVNVSAGTYNIEARVASIFAGKTFRLELDGVSIASFTVPNTGGWQTWQSAYANGVTLTAGQKILRVYAESQEFNIDKMIFTQAGNIAPTVSITSPANNASFTAPASVTINTNAADADGTISKVEFYQGTTLLSTVTSSPFNYTWSNVAAGTYSLTAKAFDNENASTTSSAVSITVNTPTNQAPTVSITSPSNNASFTAPASVTINTNAADADGTISKVEFYQGTTLLATVTSSPFNYTWSSVAAGTYSLTAKAFDNDNASTTSSAVSITVTGGGSCTAPIWNSGTAYTGTDVVQYDGIKYVANWWTMGERPDLNNGPSGSGKPWTSQGTCTSRMGETENTVSAVQVTIAPNPVENNSMVYLSTEESEEMVYLYIMDQFGRKISDLYQGSLPAGNHSFVIDSDNLTQGLYILSVTRQSKDTKISFVKQ